MQTQYTYKKPQPSAEGAYADDLSVLAYRKVLASMQEQRTPSVPSFDAFLRLRPLVYSFDSALSVPSFD